MTTDPSPLPLSQLPTRLRTLMGAGEHAAVLVALTHPDPSGVGARMLVTRDRIWGTLLVPEADREGRALARKALQGDPSLRSGTFTLPAGKGAGLDVFLELHHPSREMIIVGAGHVAQPLCAMAALLGLRVTVLDDRPEFATRERFPEATVLRRVDFSDPFSETPLHRWSHVVLVTRGHKYDYECLRRVLMETPPPGYVGMIGSRRRVRATFEALLAEGFPREKLAEVRAPIGLDVGGETPAEIALSVAAELVHHWHGGTGRPLAEKERILERFFPPGESTGQGG